MDAGAKDAPDDAAETPTGPMEAFDGAAKDGFRVDVSALREPDASKNGALNGLYEIFGHLYGTTTAP